MHCLMPPCTLDLTSLDVQFDATSLDRDSMKQSGYSWQQVVQQNNNWYCLNNQFCAHAKQDFSSKYVIMFRLPFEFQDSVPLFRTPKVHSRQNLGLHTTKTPNCE